MYSSLHWVRKSSLWFDNKERIINHPFPGSTHKLLYCGAGYHNKTSFFRKTQNIIQTKVTGSLYLSNPDQQELWELPKLIITILLSGVTIFSISSMAPGVSVWEGFCFLLSIIVYGHILDECWYVCPCLGKYGFHSSFPASIDLETWRLLWQLKNTGFLQISLVVPLKRQFT